MTAFGVAKTIALVNHNLMQVMKEGCDLATRPEQTTLSDVAAWEDRVASTIRNSSQDITNETISQVEEALTKHLISRGVLKGEAEKMVHNVITKTVDIADKVRPYAVKTTAVGKYRWVKFVGAITLGFIGVTTISMYQPNNRAEESRAMESVIRHVEAERKIALDADSYSIMLGGLLTLSAAPSVSEAPAPAAAAPALPPPIAAASATPVQVVITLQNGSTRTVNTNYGTVYREAPEPVQRVMEQTPPPITHGYDGTDPSPDPNSCYVRHCLGGGFTVAAPDPALGSIHVIY